MYMIFKAGLFKDISIKTTIEKERMNELLSYSIPLIFTAIAWWINSSLDRYFVTGMISVDANGIYSVAYKIPSLLTACQTIFTQAWAISAVKEFDKNDSDGFMGSTYETFSFLMLMACMCIMILNIPLSKMLYAKDFFLAWNYVPFLLCSTFFGALAGYYGGIFSAVKNSKITAISTVISAAINAILNFSLIPVWGVTGAAIATLIAYIVSWLIRAIFARKYIILKISKVRLITTYVLLIAQMICCLTENHLYMVQVSIIILVILLYFIEFKKVLMLSYKKIRNAVNHSATMK